MRNICFFLSPNVIEKVRNWFFADKSVWHESDFRRILWIYINQNKDGCRLMMCGFSRNRTRRYFWWRHRWFTRRRRCWTWWHVTTGERSPWSPALRRRTATTSSTPCETLPRPTTARTGQSLLVNFKSLLVNFIATTSENFCGCGAPFLPLSFPLLLSSFILCSLSSPAMSGGALNFSSGSRWSSAAKRRVVYFGPKKVLLLRAILIQFTK